MIVFVGKGSQHFAYVGEAGGSTHVQQIVAGGEVYRWVNGFAGMQWYTEVGARLDADGWGRAWRIVKAYREATTS